MASNLFSMPQVRSSAVYSVVFTVLYLGPPEEPVLFNLERYGAQTQDSLGAGGSFGLDDDAVERSSAEQASAGGTDAAQAPTRIDGRPGATAIQALSSLQCLQCAPVLALFEVSQPKPVLQLGIARPSLHRYECYTLRIGKAPCLQVTEHKPTVDFRILRKQLLRLLEVLGRAEEITGIQSILTLSD